MTSIKRNQRKQTNRQLAHNQIQYPKLDDQNVMKKLKEKHNMIKTVSKFYNQEAFIEQQRVNQHLIQKIMQPQTSKTRSQHNQSRKEFAKINFDTKRISEENRSLANRITNLPPVIDAKKQDMEYRKHQSEVVLLQKYHTTKLIEQYDQKTINIFNKLTSNKFSKSKFANFKFLSTINKQTKFMMVLISEMELYGVKHSSSLMNKNPPTYQCSIFSDQKCLFKSKPLEYNEFLENIIGFNCQDFTSIYMVIEKIKQNEEFQVGDVIYCESYSHMHTHHLKDNIIIRISDEIDGEIRKNISEEQVIVGKLKYKILQLCQQSQEYKLQVPPASYAIQIQHSTPQPSVKEPEEIPSQQLI
ncbi:unnamed protein product (macronuclear) [Paramecium tetraurelia]|uniref:Uncharacterized protein n=1 Tax=Paramecium tetraurelia TaxID=5888 RepID=A0BTZ7_PARTE|nr:uncharacterized protein GSPATT00032246001 [Paramecium tetraurelia]CAK62014.1 unnamed protein product [Paramecium tetraurelia]|eukprot:XP_001429412.1 hypothetical protein (macronuclear) [Paramecium tetraurelia strain d4-2]